MLALILGCHDGDIRLVGGVNAAEGRLEFCYGGVWGTVCRDQWGPLDARVACHQLGFPAEGSLIISSGCSLIIIILILSFQELLLY